MSALPIERVYLGYWYDHSYDSSLGATITVRSSVANIIIAILTVVITIGGAAWWELTSFFLFSLSFRSNSNRPAAIQQVLVLLKNAVSPGSFLLETLRLLYHNRHSARTALLYIFALIGVATLASSGFIVAGVFASSVVSTESINVLADSQFCGSMMATSGEGDDGLIFRQQFASAWQYSQTCYGAANSSLPQCNIFASAQPPIPQVMDLAPPFPEMHTKNDTSFSLDSGFISSRKHLGINSPEQDEVRVRQVKSCSVLSGSDYLTTINSTTFDWSLISYDNPGYDQQIYSWEFGQQDTRRGKQYNSTFLMPATYLVSPQSYLLFDFSWTNDGNGSVALPYPNNWTPLPELQAENADVFLFGVSANGLAYYEPVDDPLFATHRVATKHLSSEDGEMSVDMYESDSVMEWMACQEQFQFCFSEDGCTRLHGLSVARADAEAIEKTPLQTAIFDDVFNRTFGLLGIDLLAPEGLVAATLQQEGMSVGLPADQWKHEVTAWFNLLITTLQAGVSYYAMGDDIGFKDVDYELQAPKDEAEAALCHMQKMKAPIGISNVSVLGLALTIGVSGFLFLLNLILVPLLQVLDRRGVLPSATVRAWSQHGALQLQRRLYEAVGVGAWERLDRDTPRYGGPLPILPSLCTETSLPRPPQRQFSGPPSSATTFSSSRSDTEKTGSDVWPLK